MEARAIQRHVGIPATKVRQVIDLIRGKSVEEALSILQYTPRFSARIIEKTLRSAIANAVNRDEEVSVDADELFVSRIFADEGRTLKRLRPRARGTANRIMKRQSHVTIIVSDGRTDEAPVAEAVVDTAEE
ncbi:MAG: 50S ribosomal protein L22 [Gemmatimonadetes bacterium]|jgi:large subunit ribosomal protein L22|nr:50S ribosomal protein L22 [Gemmatimonadota bacterium]MBT7863142.1 50S ribosomal protein L22 [Gemmatimonadota bacterium]